MYPSYRPYSGHFDPAPTFETVPVVEIFTQSNLDGFGTIDLSPDQQQVIIQAQAAIAEVDVSAVEYIGARFSTNGRRLFPLTMESATSVIVTTKITKAIENYAAFEGNPISLVSYLSATFAIAIYNGQYTDHLRKSALDLGVSLLYDVSSSYFVVTDVSEAFFATSPSQASSSHSPKQLSDGEIAAAVVASIVGTIIVMVNVYVIIVQRRMSDEITTLKGVIPTNGDKAKESASNESIEAVFDDTQPREMVLEPTDREQLEKYRAQY